MTDLARSIAGMYDDQNIRAYSVNPAFFQTELVDNYGKNALPDMPEDTKMADVFGMNNPVMVGSGGDPQDIAEFVEACFDGSTLWPSGAAVVIDNGTPSCCLCPLLLPPMLILEELRRRHHLQPAPAEPRGGCAAGAGGHARPV